jgi:2-polyprenyl-6-methoxyphenol hydroxylase-like FAD-dependent oxidoreductase
MTTTEHDVAVVGAGPVGLLFALCAIAEGLRPLVLEQRAHARTESRAIGIHPPSLELLERLGLADRFLARGVRVERGFAFGSTGALGAVAFDRLAGPHRYVLTLPQADTEAILTEALEDRAPMAIWRGFGATGVSYEQQAELQLTDRAGNAGTLKAACVVACDGKHSITRRLCGIEFRGGSYDGAYAMADFPDTTHFGCDAAVFLTASGLVESFPLPRGLRRWVVRRDDISDAAEPPTAAEIAAVVADRAGYRLPVDEARGVSGFRAERWLASTLAAGPIALAGDAGHVISPIGGQGMNLGWLGAADLARSIGTAMRTGRDLHRALKTSSARRLRMARAAGRRAELNMWLGRPTPRPERRERLVGALLGGTTGQLLARAFTMRGLGVGV